MADDHRALADDYASTARQTIDAVPATEDNALQIATVEALLAIYHQLRSMAGRPVELRGAADLADAMDRLADNTPG